MNDHKHVYNIKGFCIGCGEPEEVYFFSGRPKRRRDKRGRFIKLWNRRDSAPETPI